MAARQAVDLLHHFADFVAIEPGTALPMFNRPDRKSATVGVSFAITTSYGGYGELRYGEGKYGGAEQTIVARITGERRALSSILRNVFDAWISYLKLPLPPISQY